MNTLIHDAVKQVGYAKIAKELGLRRQAVHQWRGHVPAHHVVTVSRLIGLEPWTIRPDVFPAPERETA